MSDITDEMIERAAKEMHAGSGHTFPSGKLTRWPDDLTDFQREQFRIGARRVLCAAVATPLTKEEERA